jgi:hypothetical protein
MLGETKRSIFKEYLIEITVAGYSPAVKLVQIIIVAILIYRTIVVSVESPWLSAYYGVVAVVPPTYVGAPLGPGRRRRGLRRAPVATRRFELHTRTFGALCAPYHDPD